jgi:hypothetical protein
MERASVNTNSTENVGEPHFANVFLILNQVGDRSDACPTAACKFEFSAKTIQPLTKFLREELEKL